MSRSKNSGKRRLGYESLEDRRLMATTNGIFHGIDSKGDLLIVASDRNDTVTVDNYQPRAGQPLIKLTLKSGSASTQTVYYPRAQVTGLDVDFYGHGGHDNFTNASTLRTLAFGGAGNDVIYTNTGDDTIYGGTGDDKLYGGLGHDDIFGDEGNDLLKGHDGDDDLYGGGGNDQLYGELGYDELHGDGGNDELFGGRYGDQLFGGDGNDWLFGESGMDTLHGGAGVDIMFGADGSDTFIDNADYIYVGSFVSPINRYRASRSGIQDFDFRYDTSFTYSYV